MSVWAILYKIIATQRIHKW